MCRVLDGKCYRVKMGQGWGRWEWVHPDKGHDEVNWREELQGGREWAVGGHLGARSLGRENAGAKALRMFKKQQGGKQGGLRGRECHILWALVFSFAEGLVPLF